MTDDLIEIAARALCASAYAADVWGSQTTLTKVRFRDHARAVLAAVEPVILEKAAKVAEVASFSGVSSAASIRKLKEAGDE